MVQYCKEHEIKLLRLPYYYHGQVILVEDILGLSAGKKSSKLDCARA